MASGAGMGGEGEGTRWIGPEDVPDPVAFRGVSVPPAVRVADPATTAVKHHAVVEAGTLDPLDPPSLDELALARSEELSAETFDVTSLREAAEFTLEPEPVRSVLPDADEDDDFAMVQRRTPAAVWVGGTLLLVALLAVGWMGLGLAASGPPAAVPAQRVDPPPIAEPSAAPTDPTPVDAAPVATEPAPAERHGSRRSHASTPASADVPDAPVPDAHPPLASLHPTGSAAPPEAVVRPLTPPVSAQLETPGTADAVNPWSAVDP